MKTVFAATGLRRGYTLIEVLAAAAVIAVSAAAAVSLSSSLMLQEELAWRTAITRNYQENMARLWQLGMSPTGSKDPSNIGAVMPSVANSVRLNEAINGTPFLIETGTTSPEGLGTLQTAIVSASVNVAANPAEKIQGSNFTLSVYRPSLPVLLRTSTVTR
ncbi:prepilin-type N-terminal cleavage/methylation domain-containing protein [Prosthecobacter sp. SYSU 5D2]|uniref:prepilin-type N-terminal cleavage/methylation domain-containing protein n=1 Tax=Prosthecobacter sp. SYSU 5D2 TaxID=3134134 RepID=UPI0031FF060E